jgi:hypothetical protein
MDYPNGVATYNDGTTRFLSNAILPSTIALSLIGKVGGTSDFGTGIPVPEGVPGKGTGFVGSSYSQQIPTTGRLFFAFNDELGFFGDNSGSFTVTVTVVPPPSCDPAPSGLVGWWRAESNALDSVGGNNGVLMNGAGYAPGKVGTAFQFNGVDSRVDLGDPENLKFTNSFSIEAWIWIDALPSWRGQIFFRGDPRGCLDPYFLCVEPNGAVRFHIEDDLGTVPCGVDLDTAAVSIQQWKHVAGVLDAGTGTMTVYVDGQLAAQTTTSVRPFRNLVGGGVAIGNHSVGFDAQPFNGLIDELAVYNRALTANEIQSIYLAGSGGKCNSGTTPLITTQPTNQTVTVGGTASFSVAASGTLPLSYQWNLNGTNINGATNTVLTLTNVQFSQAGNCAVLVTYSYGSILSSNAVLTVNPPPSCVPPPSGLVAWWPLDGNWVDVVGANTGVPSGSPVFGTGEVGQAMIFDGMDDSVRVPASPALNVGAGGGITIEAWIKPGDVSTQQPLVEWNNGLGFIGTHFWIAVPLLEGGPGSLYGNLVDTSKVSHLISSTTHLIVTDVFQHVALTYDKTSGLIRLYLNGSVVAQANYGTFTPDTSSDLYIGLRPSGAAAGTRFFGSLDEPGIYNRALTDVEIQALYNASITGKCHLPPSILVQPTNQTVIVGYAASFSVVADGLLPLAYQWNFNGTNLVGATNASLTLTNVQLTDSGTYAVLVTNSYGSILSSNAVLRVDRPPVADATATVPLVISCNNSNARVVLNGSRSFDPDGDPLQYFWFKAGATNAIAARTVAVVVLPVGTNSITLMVNDGFASSQQTITVAVITIPQAIGRLMGLVTARVAKPQPLIVTLSAALDSVEHGNRTAASHQLRAFQDKVDAQVARRDHTLARTLIKAAEEINDALDCGCDGNGTGHGHEHGRIEAKGGWNHGGLSLGFSGTPSIVYIIEASTNMVNWESIGAATADENGNVSFTDAEADRHSARFYRVSVE